MTDIVITLRKPKKNSFALEDVVYFQQIFVFLTISEKEKRNEKRKEKEKPGNENSCF